MRLWHVMQSIFLNCPGIDLGQINVGFDIDVVRQAAVVFDDPHQRDLLFGLIRRQIVEVFWTCQWMPLPRPCRSLPPPVFMRQVSAGRRVICIGAEALDLFQLVVGEFIGRVAAFAGFTRRAHFIGPHGEFIVLRNGGQDVLQVAGFAEDKTTAHEIAPDVTLDTQDARVRRDSDTSVYSGGMV